MDRGLLVVSLLHTLQERGPYTDGTIYGDLVGIAYIRCFSEKPQYVGVWISEMSGHRAIVGKNREDHLSGISSELIVANFR